MSLGLLFPGSILIMCSPWHLFSLFLYLAVDNCSEECFFPDLQVQSPVNLFSSTTSAAVPSKMNFTAVWIWKHKPQMPRSIGKWSLNSIANTNFPYFGWTFKMPLYKKEITLLKQFHTGFMLKLANFPTACYSVQRQVASSIVLFWPRFFTRLRQCLR